MKQVFYIHMMGRHRQLIPSAVLLVIVVVVGHINIGPVVIPYGRLFIPLAYLFMLTGYYMPMLLRYVPISSDLPLIGYITTFQHRRLLRILEQLIFSGRTVMLSAFEAFCIAVLLQRGHILPAYAARWFVFACIPMFMTLHVIFAAICGRRQSSGG
jgi:hypothetical protein